MERDGLCHRHTDTRGDGNSRTSSQEYLGENRFVCFLDGHGLPDIISFFSSLYLSRVILSSEGVVCNLWFEQMGWLITVLKISILWYWNTQRVRRYFSVSRQQMKFRTVPALAASGIFSPIFSHRGSTSSSIPQLKKFGTGRSSGSILWRKVLHPCLPDSWPRPDRHPHLHSNLRLRGLGVMGFPSSIGAVRTASDDRCY